MGAIDLKAASKKYRHADLGSEARHKTAHPAVNTNQRYRLQQAATGTQLSQLERELTPPPCSGDELFDRASFFDDRGPSFFRKYGSCD